MGSAMAPGLAGRPAFTTLDTKDFLPHLDQHLQASIRFVHTLVLSRKYFQELLMKVTQSDAHVWMNDVD